jgi:hypothetical protein
VTRAAERACRWSGATRSGVVSVSAPERGGRPGDLIEEYLRQLRAGMRLGPAEAELILAEAEDHLRETAAAALATGMAEREAQEAAISSFGSVQAVTRARLASVMLAVLAASGFHWYFLGFLPANSSFPFAGGGYVVTWPGRAGFSWPVWSAAVSAGALALAGYLLARRRQRRGELRTRRPGRSEAPSRR